MHQSLILLALAGFTSASPVPLKELRERSILDSITDLLGPSVGDFVASLDSQVQETQASGDQNFAATTNVDALGVGMLEDVKRAAHFSNVAYCSAPSVVSWQCGDSCAVLGDVEVLFTAGNNQDLPAFYIAFDPAIQSIVVSTQGTETAEFDSILIDIELDQSPFNLANFPSATADVLVHSGFQKAFERGSSIVLSEVDKALQSKGVNKVLLTGHSLGAAMATFNAAFIKEQLGDRVDVTTHVFGNPRVGNGPFADYIDRILGADGKYLHFHAGKDVVPSLPPHALLDYTHPSGEIFDNLSQIEGLSAVFCPGQENQNCAGANSFLQLGPDDHAGPYAGVSIGNESCVF